jgi:hypothetical protein
MIAKDCPANYQARRRLPKSRPPALRYELEPGCLGRKFDLQPLGRFPIGSPRTINVEVYFSRRVIGDSTATEGLVAPLSAHAPATQRPLRRTLLAGAVVIGFAILCAVISTSPQREYCFCGDIMAAGRSFGAVGSSIDSPPLPAALVDRGHRRAPGKARLRLLRGGARLAISG